MSAEKGKRKYRNTGKQTSRQSDNFLIGAKMERIIKR
jgi:hypothetical protein